MLVAKTFVRKRSHFSSDLTWEIYDVHSYNPKSSERAARAHFTPDLQRVIGKT